MPNKFLKRTKKTTRNGITLAREFLPRRLLAVINDHNNMVQIYMQQSLLDHKWIYLHPCRNTHSTRLKTVDLLTALAEWNHTVTPLDFN